MTVAFHTVWLQFKGCGRVLVDCSNIRFFLTFTSMSVMSIQLGGRSDAYLLIAIHSY